MAHFTLNSLREVIFIWHCYLETHWSGKSVPKKCCSCFSHFLDDRYGASSEALGAVDIVVE